MVAARIYLTKTLAHSSPSSCPYLQSFRIGSSSTAGDEEEQVWEEDMEEVEETNEKD
jgi:hypothetical protein